MKKIRNFLSRLGMYGFLFVFILFSLGIVSGYRVLKFWIDGEALYNEWSLDLGSKGEVEYISSFWGKYQFLNLNGFMRKLTGQREMNDVIKLNNGYLAVPYAYVGDEELEQSAAALANLNMFLAAADVEFLVAIAPDTISKYDPQVPPGLEEYVNDNLDRLGIKLQGQGINVMDFREEIYEDGIDQYTMMYKTDHHWTTRAGFYAYGKLADWIEEKTGVAVDEKIRNIDNYSVKDYENWHLGSRGQRTGCLFAGMDDFEVILPDFETMLQSGDRTGTFEELLISYKALEKRDITSRYTYDVTFENACGNYKNLLATNDLRLLVVGDSFAKTVCPYLNISYQETDFVHCEWLEGFTADYIAEYDPDVVILLYYPENILGQSGFTFHVPNIEKPVP